MLSNPPYGKSWASEQKFIKDGANVIDPRFKVTLKDYWCQPQDADAAPRSSDGQLLFLMEMVSKMKTPDIVSPAYYVFSFIKEIIPNYFSIAIRSRLYISFFGSASDGVRIGQWDLSKTRMKSIPFLVPSPEEQTAIANFLDCKTTKIDQAIAIREKQIQLLKERKQILIQTAIR